MKIKRGLDIPVSGEPKQVIHDGPEINRVALLGHDYVGMKPTMLVAEGDRVKLGQALFADKNNPDVMFAATSSRSSSDPSTTTTSSSISRDFILDAEVNARGGSGVVHVRLLR